LLRCAFLPCICIYCHYHHIAITTFGAFIQNAYIGSDPNETYNYHSCDDCALARYAKSRGVDYNGAYDLGFDIERIVGDAGKNSSCVKMWELVTTLKAALLNE